jgi:hypothetical protein
MFESLLKKYNYQIIHQLLSFKKLDFPLYEKHEIFLRSIIDHSMVYRGGYYTINDLKSKYNKPKISYANIDEFLKTKSFKALFTTNYISWDENLLKKYEKEIFLNKERAWLCHATNIKWTKDIVLKYFNELDIHQLYKNKSFIWSDEVIDIFTDLTKFHESNVKNTWKYLLSNDSNIEWSERLINKYEDKICFKTLSANQSVNWTIPFIDKHFEKWDWGSLSGNPSMPLNPTFLLRYEEKFNWAQGRKFSSISSNPSIYWTLELFEFFIDKIDIFLISKFANIDEKIILKYANRFNFVRSVGYESHSFSDWKDGHETFSTPWEALANNPNFKFSFKLICYLSGMKTIKKMFSGSPSVGYSEYEITVDTLEYIKNCKIKKKDVIKLLDSDLLSFFINPTTKQIIYKDSKSNNYIHEPFINESVWKAFDNYFDDYNNLKDFLSKSQRVKLRLPPYK